MTSIIVRRALLAAAAAIPLGRPGAAQEAFPSHPLRLIVPYAAGGGTDAVARTLAARLQGPLGQPVVVENRPGAGGNIATEAAAGARPDGYTLLVGNQGPMAVNPTLFPRFRIDPATALDPVALMADAPLVLVVGPGTRADSLRALIEEGKRTAGGLSYGSASNGSASHLAAALLCQLAGMAGQHVPFRGAAPALNDVVAGNIAFMVTTLPSVTGLIEGRAVRALAVTGERRAAVLPDVPTVAESGLPGYRASAWYGILVPHGTPEPVRERLAAALRESLADAGVAERLRQDGAEPARLEGVAFGRFIADERQRWAGVIRAANISVD